MGTATIIVTKQQIEYSTRLETLSCGACEIPFAMPLDLHRKVQANGDWFWCPNGHKIHYFESEENRLRRQLKAQKDRNAQAQEELTAAYARIVHEADQRKAAERTASARKGVVTRMRNRAAAGVCQACHRTFANVAAHMDRQHPGYRDEPVA